MHEILTGFESKIQQLIVAFRFVVFALMTIGLVVHSSQHHYHLSSVIRPLGRALTIVALIASMGWWFPMIEKTLLAAAEYINADYVQNPTQAADMIREGATPNPEGKNWSWRKLNESLYHAVTDAVTFVFITLSTLLTGPMLIMQYVLRWVLYLLTPFALATFMIPALQGLGVRFFQQVIAVLSWPVGFAITNLVALSIWQDFNSAIGADSPTLGIAAASAFVATMGGLLGGITLLVGTLATPLICQQLFASGSAFTGNAGSPATIVRTMSEIHSRISSLTSSRSGGGGRGGASAGAGSGGSNAGSGSAASFYGAPGTPGAFGAAGGSSTAFGGGVNSSPGAFGGQATTNAPAPPPPPPMLAASPATPGVPGI